MTRIDAHQHLWSISRADYHWIAPDDPLWGQDFLPSDLDPLRRAAGVEKTILVQAAWTVEETNYLLGLADATDWIAGVIGWVDFEDAAQIEQIRRFASHPKLLGLRPMVQEISQQDWVLREDIAWAFDAIISHDLVFEALGFARQAKVFNELFARYPNMRTVVDHGMKPQIAKGEFESWAADMKMIAAQPHVFCKLSGLLTEAHPGAGVETLQPYVDLLLESFGPKRLMWGSDWPVLLAASTYERWVSMTESLLSDISDDDCKDIWHGTATRFYHLEPSETPNV